MRVVYRQAKPCRFEESTMRLRDGAMALADYNIWKSHDVLDPENCDPDAIQRSDNYLFLCAENAYAGRRNGVKVGNRAETEGFPIIRYESTRNNIAAKKLKPDVFFGLLTVTRIGKQEPVMLTCNRLYGVEKFLLGITNGARGEVIGPDTLKARRLPGYRNM